MTNPIYPRGAAFPPTAARYAGPAFITTLALVSDNLSHSRYPQPEIVGTCTVAI